MTIIKKVFINLAIIIMILTVLLFALTIPSWPSKAELCQRVENFLPEAECIRQESTLEIIERAFPEGEVSSSDVKSVLGDYLHAEYPTSYGHREVYYLSVRPIDYIFNYFDSYDFGYDNNEILISISYDDF